MATSTGYDTGIRSALNQKGVDNSKIGYNKNSGYVTVDGKDFIKADKNYAGTTYTTKQNFNSAWDNYNKAQQQPAQTYQQPEQYNPYNNTQTQNPYTSQADNIIKQLLNYGQNQGNFDPYSSSGYKAAEAQTQRAAQQSTRAAQEAYGSAGFGRSTALGERVTGINNDATEYLLTQVVPQLEAQEAARRQQEYNNSVTALQQLLGQQGRADQLVQQDFGNNITTSELTGNYRPQGADQIISDLLALKNQAERQGITAGERSGLSSQADTLRSQLTAMGIDPALFGSNVSASQAAANRNTAGQRTLEGQAQDYSQQADTRDFNEGVRQYNTNLQYTQGRDKVADAQWQKEFDRILEQDGIQNALAWAQNSISQQNANTSAFSASTSRMNANQSRLMDIWQATGFAPAGIDGVPEGTPYSSGSTSSAGQTDYTTDPSFAQDISWINQNPNEALAEIQSNAEALIAQYGYKGYQELLKAAEE